MLTQRLPSWIHSIYRHTIMSRLCWNKKDSPRKIYNKVYGIYIYWHCLHNKGLMYTHHSSDDERITQKHRLVLGRGRMETWKIKSKCKEICAGRGQTCPGYGLFEALYRFKSKTIMLWKVKEKRERVQKATRWMDTITEILNTPFISLET